MISPKKKVLIVTFYFPPSGGAAVQRVLRVISHIYEHDWEPIILTVSNGDFPTRDDSLLHDLPPKLKIFRTYIPEPYRLYRKLTGRKSEENLDLATLAASEYDNVKFSERIASFLRTWFFIPDARIGWLPFALTKGIEIIKREKIDLIFSTAPPNTVHLIAAGLKQLTKKKWVADFRDPWIKYLVPKRTHTIPFKLDIWLNKLVVKKADHLVWVGEGVKKEVNATTGYSFPDKESIITNGFNEDDFNLESKSSEKFKISYIGSLYIKYDFQAFMIALESIFDRNRKFCDDLELVFCGRVDEGIAEKFRQTTFKRNVKFVGHQDHNTTLETMLSSSLLLLYIIDSPEGKRIPTCKLFEYIGAKRPIFALAPEDSEAAKIIKETRTGIVVAPNSSKQIKLTLLDLYKKWGKGMLKKLDHNAEEIEKYEANNLTKRLVEIWNELLSK